MIQLRSDCLVFKTAAGCVPCSAEVVAIELMGDSALLIDPEVIHQVSAAVLEYFREDLHRDVVSVNEFSQALAKVLRGFGYQVIVEPEEPTKREPSQETRGRPTDLAALAAEAGGVFELGFFGRLRQEMHEQLRQGPVVLRFIGLRRCVKQLTGARRWCGRCRRLNDQIVEYLRRCLDEERPRGNCALLVM